MIFNPTVQTYGHPMFYAVCRTEVIAVKYEALLDEAYENGLIVKEKPLQAHDGRIKGKRIAIRSSIETNAKKGCVLAEELGHYYMNSGDVINQDDVINRKQERLARQWAYKKLLPVENIQFALSDGYTQIWEMAEYLDVDEEFLKEALIYYGILDI